MEPKAEIFDKIYRDYLSRIAELDTDDLARRLDLKKENNELIIPVFGKAYKVSSKGIFEADGTRPDTMLHYSISVVLSKYLILCPEILPSEGDWLSYKDFKDNAPFVGGFFNTAERPLAEYFSGKADELKKACEQIGGRIPDISLAYEVSMRFDALPNIPLLLLFNDADSDFPAQCRILFRKSAEKYLDPECLAMVGMLLANSLKYITNSVKGKCDASFR